VLCGFRFEIERKSRVPPLGYASVEKFPPLEEILLHDADGLIVVAKPSNWPSTGHTLDDPESVRFQVEAAFGRRIWAIHQLDKPTSGVFLMVRKKNLVAHWQKNLRAGQKSYWALCQGQVSWQKERVQSQIGYVPEAGKVVTGPHGRDADTRFRRLSVGAKSSLVEAMPRTGRTHQIRVHIASLGHPIHGDHLYGDIELAPRAMLHCARIRLGGKTFEAPPPSDFIQACTDDGLPCPPEADTPTGKKEAP
jgi:23S rRNA-/tRNA-specific pseudouridylate synthase